MLADYNGPSIPVRAFAGAESVVLPINFISQGAYSQLCWAACCAMLLTADGTPTTLTGAASKVLGGSVRDIAVKPGDALSKVGLQYTSPPGDGGAPLSAAFLTSQIVNVRKPVEVYWVYRRDPSSGHVGLVTGFDPSTGKYRLLDPLTQEMWVVYDYLYHYNGTDSWDSAYWSNTFYEIGAPLGGPS
jgi:hypothetical protein